MSTPTKQQTLVLKKTVEYEVGRAILRQRMVAEVAVARAVGNAIRGGQSYNDALNSVHAIARQAVDLLYPLPKEPAT